VLARSPGPRVGWARGGAALSRGNGRRREGVDRPTEAVVVARSVGGVVASKVPVGTSGTNKLREGRFRITHESAPCFSNRIPTRS